MGTETIMYCISQHAVRRQNEHRDFLPGPVYNGVQRGAVKYACTTVRVHVYVCVIILFGNVYRPDSTPLILLSKKWLVVKKAREILSLCAPQMQIAHHKCNSFSSSRLWAGIPVGSSRAPVDTSCRAGSK